METTINITTAQTASSASHRGNPRLGTCAWSGTAVRSGGSNFEFGQRSKRVHNPKDKYGFRKMSPFKATYAKQVQPNGTRETINKASSVCNPQNRSTGSINGGMDNYFKSLTTRLTAPGEQSPDLMFMRAESNLKQQDLNLLQFAAFLPSTLKNIRDNLIKMDSLLDILHDKRKLMQRFKGTEYRSLYLQWLFVWNQLHRDIVGGAKFLKKQSRPIGSLVTGRSNADSSFTDASTVRVSSGAYTAGNATCMSVTEVGQRAVSIARITCDVSYTYNALGINNPVYLLWDLIRWSWVIDQVVDIGLFIQSITSIHGLEFLGTSYTRRAVNTSIVTIESLPDTSSATYNAEYSPGTSIRKQVDRLVRSNPTRNVTLRNPFQNSVAVTAAVAAAVSLKMRNVDIDPILRRA